MRTREERMARGLGRLAEPGVLARELFGVITLDVEAVDVLLARLSGESGRAPE